MRVRTFLHAVTAATLLVVLIVGATPAGAASALNSRTNGPVAGGLTLQFGFPCTGIGHEQAMANVDVPGIRDAVLAFDVCVDYSMIVTSGSFALLTPSGTLAGHVSGSQTPGTFPVTLDFTFTVEHGTRSFAFTGGTLHLDAQWTSFGANNLTGDLTASLRYRSPFASTARR
jgi:hypothetical protein